MKTPSRNLIIESAKILKGELISEAKYVLSADEANWISGRSMAGAMKSKDGADVDLNADEPDITFTATSPSDAQRKCEKAIKDHINKEVKRDRNAVYQFNGLQLSLVDDKSPSSTEKNMLKRIIDKYDQEPIFNTSNGKGPSNVMKFINDEGIDEYLLYGAM